MTLKATWQEITSPVITNQPGSLSWSYGDAPANRTLSVDVEAVGADEKIKYQWYQVESGIETAISDATEKSYMLPEMDAGKYEYYCIVTKVVGNGSYSVTSATATVTVNPVNAVAATVTANNRTYDLTTQPLVKVDNSTLVGGTMIYAIGTNATTAPDDSAFTPTVPTGLNTGTYYVWYMAKGDTNHNDSEAKCVAVTIAEKKSESVTETQETVPDVGEEDEQGASFHLLLARQKKVTKNSITFTWNKVPGAKSYTIYGCACGQHKAKKLKAVSGTSYTWKKLKSGKFYKVYVVAQNGSEVLAKSSKIHVATSGKKDGNPVSVSVKKKAVRLKVGKTWKIGARVKKKCRGQHQGLRYESDNPAVATVSKNGKIKAVAPGKCYVYAYAQNGVYKRVRVTVR
jgi:fibronectin type 3 domain-containing protein